jgi:hypothetical protein
VLVSGHNVPITFSGGMTVTGGGFTAAGVNPAISWSTATATISPSYVSASPTRIISSGSGLNISTSTDGVAWSTTTLPTPSGSQTANQVIYANGQWVIAGNPFTCSWTSTDGTSWTVHNFSQPTGTAGAIEPNLVYGNGLYVGMIHDNTANSYMVGLYSSDGVTWSTSTITNTSGAGPNVRSLATNGTQFFGWDGSYSQYYYTSTNGTTWTNSFISGGLGNSGSSTWTAERGFMYQPVSPGYFGCNNNPSSATDWSAYSTVSTTLSSGLGIMAFPISGMPTILIQTPLANVDVSAILSVSYDGGYTFVNTTLPSNSGYLGGQFGTIFKNKIYLFRYDGLTNTVFIGSPST